MSNQKKLIEFYENSNQLLNAAVDKIIVEVVNRRKNFDVAQTIVLTGCSPLAGTTSVSISLAIAMAMTGRKTALIDCDVRKAVEYKKLNENTQIGLADYLSNAKETTDNIEDIIYDTNIECLKFVPCGESNENPTRVLCSEQMDVFLDSLKKRFDCIIFDFPSFSVVPDVQIMFAKCEGIIFVSSLGETKKAQIKDAKRLIAPYAEKYYGMIINKVSLDVYKSNVKNYDYYLLDKNGKQKFENSDAYKKRKKNKKKEGATK